MIGRAFPSVNYAGPVTTHDHELDDPDLDDCQFLYDELRGKEWTSIPSRVLDAAPDGYVFLTNEAFVAYLAAWLMRALDDGEGGEIVRDYVVYTFSPNHNAPALIDFVVSKIRCLNSKQLVALRELLEAVAESDPSPFQRKLAHEAVVLIDAQEK